MKLWYKQRTVWSAAAFGMLAILTYMKAIGVDPALLELVEKLTLGVMAIFLRSAVERSGPQGANP